LESDWGKKGKKGLKNNFLPEGKKEVDFALRGGKGLKTHEGREKSQKNQIIGLFCLPGGREKKGKGTVSNHEERMRKPREGEKR